jgi:hypothetical protein
MLGVEQRVSVSNGEQKQLPAQGRRGHISGRWRRQQSQ